MVDRSARCGWLVLCALVGFACSEPAHVVVRLEATPALAARASELRIVTFDEETPATILYDASFRFGEDDNELPPLDTSPAQFTLVPSGPRFHIRLELRDGEGELIARSNTDGTFPTEGGQLLALSMADSCEHIECDPGSTCVDQDGRGACVSSCFGLLPIGTNALSETVECGCEGRPNGATCGAGRCWEGACCEGCWSADGRCVSPDELSVGQCGAGGRECSACECEGDRCDPEIGCIPRVEARRIAVGDEHACVASASGVYCWGDNTNGELGQGGANPLEPSIAWDNGEIGQVAVGSSFSCGLSFGSRITCWGSDGQGQLPFTEGDTANPPDAQVEENLRFDEIDAGISHGCATRDGVLECWGANWTAQLGRPIGPPQFEPAPVSLDRAPIDAFDAGRRNTCAIVGGELYCTGQNSEGQVRAPVTESAIDTFVRTFEAIEWRDVSIYIKGCGIDAQGAHYCWGTVPADEFRQCEPSCDEFADTAFAYDAPPATSIDAAFHHCILGDRAGRGAPLYCYGARERSGVHGGPDGNPARVGPLGWLWSDVRTGISASCAVREDRTVWCWGGYSSNLVGEAEDDRTWTRPVRRCLPLP